MANTIEELEAGYDAIKKRQADIKSLIQKRAEDAANKVREQLHAEFASEIKSLRDERQAAYLALKSAKDAAAKSELEGKTVTREVQPNWRSSRTETQIGIVEVVRSDTIFSNRLRHTPSVGQIIVRKLKADGSPSKEFYDYYLRDDSVLKSWKVMSK